MNFVTKRQLRAAVAHAVKKYKIEPSDPPIDVRVEINQPTVSKMWHWEVIIVQQREYNGGLRRIRMQYMGGLPHRFDRCDGWVSGKARSWHKANEQAQYVKSLFDEHIIPMLEIVVLHELDSA